MERDHQEKRALESYEGSNGIIVCFPTMATTVSPVPRAVPQCGCASPSLRDGVLCPLPLDWGRLVTPLQQQNLVEVRLCHFRGWNSCAGILSLHVGSMAVLRPPYCEEAQRNPYGKTPWSGLESREGWVGWGGGGWEKGDGCWIFVIPASVSFWLQPHERFRAKSTQPSLSQILWPRKL